MPEKKPFLMEAKPDLNYPLEPQEGEIQLPPEMQLQIVPRPSFSFEGLIQTLISIGVLTPTIVVSFVRAMDGDEKAYTYLVAASLGVLGFWGFTVYKDHTCNDKSD